MFSNLSRIEGCLRVKGFTGSKNLSFFSNLKEVLCDKKKAQAANISNVINVQGENFRGMGFNSLRNVTGPGEIIITYLLKSLLSQDPWAEYHEAQCFTKEELLFLANHRQFKGRMYVPCKTEDRCLRLDHHKRDYDLDDIPKNCTIFYGSISILGPYSEEYILGRFNNLKVIIGILNIGATLLNRLDTVFPRLEVVYPHYVFTRLEEEWDLMNVYSDRDLYTSFQSVQYVHTGINRFLKNLSIPTLLPIRPLDVGDPTDLGYYLNYDMQAYRVDTTEEMCSQFPKFKASDCGVFIKYISDSETEHYDYSLSFSFLFETWLLSTVFVAVGVIYSCRAMILLIFSKANKSLSYSRILILVVIAVMSMAAVENYVIYQRAMQMYENKVYFLPQFESLLLFHPASKWMMTFLPASKHASLAVIILCYVDIAVFNLTRSQRTSKGYCSLVLVFSFFFASYLNSQLFLAIRGVEPIYFRGQDQLLYMPFVMNVAYAAQFSHIAPDTDMLVSKNDGQLFFPNAGILGAHYTFDEKMPDLPFDVFGQSLPDFANICDIAMFIVVVVFYLFKNVKLIIPHGDFTPLILLYFQLSMNRIRFFIHNTILTRDYCLRKDWVKTNVNFGSGNHFNGYTFASCYDAVGHFPIIMTRYQWDVLERMLEKLPYVGYLIVSYFCYKFARFHSYLGAALHQEEIREANMSRESDSATFTV